jgi:4-hydroxy-4-methyl-2-oxoglutarate aldolase
VIGDLDGVVVVKRETAADVLKLAVARIEKEVQMRRQLGSGELGVDVLGLRAKLTDLGVEYID